MTNYTNLIERLRSCSRQGTRYGMAAITMADAADEIDALTIINNRFRELLDNRNKDVAELQRKVDELTSQIPKHGEWIYQNYENGNWCCTCSNCGKGDLHAIIGTVPYCWNCGAKMEVHNNPQLTKTVLVGESLKAEVMNNDK